MCGEEDKYGLCPNCSKIIPIRNCPTCEKKYRYIDFIKFKYYSDEKYSCSPNLKVPEGAVPYYAWTEYCDNEHEKN